MRTFFLSSLTGLVVLCLVCLPALAQTTGTIRGQIKDADGDPLPGVTVTATSPGRGTSRTVVTGETGAYALPSMVVETYTVTAVLQGFQEQKFENVRVGISSIVTLDMAMNLSTIEDTILVSSSPPMLDLSLGRSFETDPITIQIDLQLFNVFNNDAHDSWQTLIVAPGDPYYPRAYVLPRRLGLRLGVRF